MQNLRNNKRRISCHWAIGNFCLVAAIVLAFSSLAQAQQAVVAVAQRVTQKKAGSANWVQAGKGTALTTNNLFRTGKRSKADLKFRDGSLLRLGQLSLVELRGAKNVQLRGGQILFSMLKGGRVLAGSAAAAIKGSVGIIELRDDGTAVFTLYSGAMDVEAGDETVEVPPGTQVVVSPDGTISKPRRVAIFYYAGGTLHPELTEPPLNAPYVGSPTHELVQSQPSRIVLDDSINLSQIAQFGRFPQAGLNVYPSPQNVVGPPAPILNFYNPFGAPPPELGAAGTFAGTFNNGTYTITQIDGVAVNYPTLAFLNFPAGQNFAGNFTGNYVVATGGQNAGQTVTFTENNGGVSTLITFADPNNGVAGYSYVDAAGQRVTGNFNPSLGPFSRTAPLLAQNGIQNRQAALSMPLGRNSGISMSSGGSPAFVLNRAFGSKVPKVRIAQADDAMPETVTPETVTPETDATEFVIGEADGEPIDLSLTAAYQHLDEVSSSNGRSRGGSALFTGSLTDGGTNTIGAYLHGTASRGLFFVDGVLRPLRLESNGNSTNLSTISDLSLTLRNQRGEIQAGRQRFLSGPAQVTQFGSLIRQGSREVMDAVRIAPNIGAGRKLELAYIYDAFPTDLPYQIGGAQNGFYGRFSLHRPYGNFGLNLLKYTDTPVASTTGYSVDFAVPLKRNEVELYGELGRDMFSRRLATVGLAFPGLYDKTDYDLYVEYSDLGTGTALAPPNELSARVYRNFGDNFSAVLAVSRFSNFDTKVTLGLAFGQGSNSGYNRGSR